jgi:hypothetical protein
MVGAGERRHGEAGISQTGSCGGDGSRRRSRKNFLFVGSDRGGRTAAVLHRLVGSCERLWGDLFAYLKDVFERPPTHPIDRLAEPLPDVWSAAHRRASRKVAS